MHGHKKITKELVSRLWELHDEGLVQVVIAKRLDISQNTVSKELKKGKKESRTKEVFNA